MDNRVEQEVEDILTATVHKRQHEDVELCLRAAQDAAPYAVLVLALTEGGKQIRFSNVSPIRQCFELQYALNELMVWVQDKREEVE